METAYSAVTDPPSGVEMHSALDDPFLGAKEEVRDALQKLQKMHEEWKRLVRSGNSAGSDRFQYLHVEIPRELQGLGDDLEGISSAIKAVEDNRKSFPVDDAEMSRRRDFLRTSQATLQDIRANVNNPRTLKTIEADKREALLRPRPAAPKAAASMAAGSSSSQGGVGLETNDSFLNNNDFLGGERFQQQRIYAEQEDYMLDIGKAAARMKEAAQTINTEILYQNDLLEEVDEDIDRETAHLNGVMKNVGRILQTSDSSQLYTIIALSVLFFILLFFVIV